MAITPVSDLVLDVARAADPARASAASARLAALGAGQAAPFPAAPAAGPDRAAGAVGEWPLGFRRVTPSGFNLWADGTAGAARASGAPGDQARSVYQRFEGLVLQSFLETMLPEQAGGLYGSGLSGKVWRSMLAEQLGGALATAGGIGLADRMAGRPPRTLTPNAL